jgi:hypothetical protein
MACGAVMVGAGDGDGEGEGDGDGDGDGEGEGVTDGVCAIASGTVEPVQTWSATTAPRATAPTERFRRSLFIERPGMSNLAD